MSKTQRYGALSKELFDSLVNKLSCGMKVHLLMLFFAYCILYVRLENKCDDLTMDRRPCPNSELLFYVQDRLWLKNRNTAYNHSCPGVDLNRNFDFHWGGKA